MTATSQRNTPIPTPSAVMPLCYIYMHIWALCIIFSPSTCFQYQVLLVENRYVVVVCRYRGNVPYSVLEYSTIQKPEPSNNSQPQKQDQCATWQLLLHVLGVYLKSQNIFCRFKHHQHQSDLTVATSRRHRTLKSRRITLLILRPASDSTASNVPRQRR